MSRPCLVVLVLLDFVQNTFAGSGGSMVFGRYSIKQLECRHVMIFYIGGIVGLLNCFQVPGMSGPCLLVFVLLEFCPEQACRKWGMEGFLKVFF